MAEEEEEEEEEGVVLAKVKQLAEFLRSSNYTMVSYLSNKFSVYEWLCEVFAEFAMMLGAIQFGERNQ